MRIRQSPRTRREIPKVALVALSPLFKFSPNRDAYILRAVGRRHGPVLARRGLNRRHGFGDH